MLTLPESLTQASASACLRTLSDALARESAVVVDASRLKQFDSAALALLLELRRQAIAQGKTFAIEGRSRQLTDLSRVYGIDSLLAGPGGTAPVK